MDYSLTPGNDLILGTPDIDIVHGKASTPTADYDSISTFAGDDRISGGSAFAYIDAGEGDDTVSFNLYEGNSTIQGGDGSDRIRLTFDTDAGGTVYGGNGHDVFIDVFSNVRTSSSPSLAFAGGAGTDTILVSPGGSYSARFDPGTMIINSIENLVLGKVFESTGTFLSGFDRIETQEPETSLVIYLTDDSLFRGGNIRMTAGIDYRGYIHGMAAVTNMDLTGATGNFSLFSDLGVIGDDHLTGGSGNDIMDAAGGADAYDGGDGGRDGVSYVTSSVGVIADMIDLSRNTGFARGDTYVSIEELYGSYYQDDLRGDGANNLLFGGGGDDLLEGGVGADRLDGNEGNDTANYDHSASAVRVDLGFPSRTALGDAQGDSFVSIENVRGSAFDDSLRGSGVANFLEGRNGNDRLDGRAGRDHLKGEYGDDILIGGAGADLLDGGRHTDTASYETAAFGVRADLSNYRLNSGDAASDRFISIENLLGSAQNDSLRGNVHANVLTGGGGDDDLSGQGGDDLLIGGTGADTIDGSLGQDTASYETSSSAVRADLANNRQNSLGDATGDDLISIENLRGSAFGDSLRGDAGGNVLSGNGGDDVLHGRGGADILVGGAGRDMLTGGTGSDRFVFAAGRTNPDVVTDYESGIDRLDLSKANPSALPFLFSMTDTDGDGAADDTQVDFGSGLVFLLDTQANDINMSDFILA